MFWLYAAWCAPAWADVYGFIDEQGVAHLAPRAIALRKQGIDNKSVFIMSYHARQKNIS